ncbi:MAG TPA: metallophosphoesterase [Planctomycetaceae bacterium]|nr:metallophosphoesterase [Planctomycetaceae bacterium]
MNAGFWVVWFVTCAGMAKLLAIAENSLHSCGFRRLTLQRVRGVHNVLLFSYPLLLIWRVGFTGPHWATAASISPIGTKTALWLLPGLVGFVLLILSTIRHLTYRPPAFETVLRSQVIDVAQRVPLTELIGEGRAKWLARLPRNQQFQLEISEKSYPFARLPKAWDGLSIVHFSDLHYRGPVTRRYFEEVMREAAALNGDMIFFTGDLMDHRQCLEWIPSTLGKLSAPLGCYFVLGNHDWYLPVTDEMRRRLASHGWQDTAGRVLELQRGDDRLVIAGTERPWMGTAPDFTGVPENVFRILLSHGPDQIDWAEANRVDLMFAGHTHGGQIQLPVIGPVYAPSRYSCRYASGVFYRPPTLMLVTRGISGREPIRYNCRPELTKVILRCEPAHP